MNAFLNYLVEANLGLCLMLLMYVLFLRNETDFAVKRVFLLISVTASLVFPLIQIEGVRYAYLPSLMDVLPTTWLPEIVITAEGVAQREVSAINAWAVVSVLYSIGMLAALGLFCVRLFMIARTLVPLRHYRLDNHLIY